MSLVDIIDSAASRYGVDGGALARIGQLESGLDPNAANGASSAKGLFQFTKGTATQMGLSDPNDPAAASDAAARLMANNKAYLTKVLGRDPTGGELYLAHQQGAGGAAQLLENPGVPASQVVGDKAISLNGGTPGMTAGDFANMWVSRFNGVQAPKLAAQNAAPAGAPNVAPNPTAAPASVSQPTQGTQLAAMFDPSRIAPALLQDAVENHGGVFPTVANGGVARRMASRGLATAVPTVDPNSPGVGVPGGLGALFLQPPSA